MTLRPLRPHRPSSRCRRRLHTAVALLGALTLLVAACGSSDDDASGGTTTTGAEATPSTTAARGSEVPDGSSATAAAEGAQWGDNVTLTVEGGEIHYESDGIPNHEYLDAYQQLPAGDLQTVGEVPVDISVPLVPEVADATTETGMGAIGFTLSGAVLFDPYEGDGTTLAYDDNFTIDGVPFIDDCGGHPAPPAGQYHYHGIPTCITSEVDTAGGHSVLLGYLLDGFGVYGPQGADGDAPTDLDACNGHFGPTPEFPQGAYHYHLTETAPYAPTCYHGTVDAAGTQVGPPGGGPPAGGPAAKTVALATRYCHLPAATTPSAA